jgi:hypothetical protein
MCAAQASRNKMIEELEGELKTSQGDVKAQIFELTALRKEVAELRAAAAAPPPEVDVSGDVEALKELLRRGVRSDVDAAQAKLAVAEANIAALATDNETLQLVIRTLQEAQETATAAVNKIVGDLERELKETREEAEKLINEARATAAASSSADKKEVEKLRQQLRKAQEELAVAVKKSDDILASSLAAKAVRDTPLTYEHPSRTSLTFPSRALLLTAVTHTTFLRRGTNSFWTSKRTSNATRPRPPRGRARPRPVASCKRCSRCWRTPRRSARRCSRTTRSR